MADQAIPGLEALCAEKAQRSNMIIAEIVDIARAYQEAREQELEAKQACAELLRRGATLMIKNGHSKVSVSRVLGVSRQRLHEILVESNAKTEPVASSAA